MGLRYRKQEEDRLRRVNYIADTSWLLSSFSKAYFSSQSTVISTLQLWIFFVHLHVSMFWGFFLSPILRTLLHEMDRDVVSTRSRRTRMFSFLYSFCNTENIAYQCHQSNVSRPTRELDNLNKSNMMQEHASCLSECFMQWNRNRSPHSSSWVAQFLKAQSLGFIYFFIF